MTRAARDKGTSLLDEWGWEKVLEICRLIMVETMRLNDEVNTNVPIAKTAVGRTQTARLLEGKIGEERKEWR